jgi:hypothetical protein
MRLLEQTFTKNGLTYDIINRTERVGLFKLSLDGEHVGWEVSKITQNSEYEIAGKVIPSGESITSNEAFGSDGSKAFFPTDENRAMAYFIEFDQELQAKAEEKANNAKFTTP